MEERKSALKIIDDRSDPGHGTNPRTRTSSRCKTTSVGRGMLVLGID